MYNIGETGASRTLFFIFQRGDFNTHKIKIKCIPYGQKTCSATESREKNAKKLTKRPVMAKLVEQKIGPTCPMAGASRLNLNFTRGK